MRWMKAWTGMLVGAALVGLAAHAAAFPQFARDTKLACSTCHMIPAGGPDLTDAGKAYKADKKAPAAGAAKAAEYVGIGKCKMCHYKQYKAWLETPHSHALSNLKNADPKAAAEMAGKLKVELTGNPASNDACVVCHVAGFQLAGGYTAADTSKVATLGNVTCEACHGPGSLHVAAAAADKKKLINRNVTANLCMQCHTSVTSPKFNFEEFKAKGVHKVSS